MGKALYTSEAYKLLLACDGTRDKLKMAYFLGRDVKVAITTEDADRGIEISAATPDVAQPSTATSGDVIEILGGTLFDHQEKRW